MVCRPSLWWVFLYHWPMIVLPALVFVMSDVVWRQVWPPTPFRISLLAIVWALLVLEYRILGWLSRAYVLTERRLLVVSGFLARDMGDVPLTSVQHEVVYQNWWERVLGLGSVGVATAGTDGVTMIWASVAHPSGVLSLWRSAIDRARGVVSSIPTLSAPKPQFREPVQQPIHHAPSAMNTPLESVAPRAWFPVIGLAGGIGSGKSTVGREFERLGCVVIDSDKEAREALDRDDVREHLVQWWGARVVRPDGKVDRRAVADIVFTQPGERARLETLIHPLVRAQRADLKERAAGSGARGVVVDAPLLFEAGVDAECDVVVFVDAPREERLERVLRTRGWDARELERRESSQMPLDEKRSRCGIVIHNTGTPGDLARSVRQAMEQIEALRPGI
jgi:dephospho-CoA kinase